MSYKKLVVCSFKTTEPDEDMLETLRFFFVCVCVFDRT